MDDKPASNLSLILASSGLSLVAHVAIVLAFTRAMPTATRAPESHEVAIADDTVDIESSVTVPYASTALLSMPNPSFTEDSPPRSGGAVVARPQDGSGGRGGDDTAREQAINLSDGNENLKLSPDVTSHLDRDQHNRLRTGRSRASWEDRRATPHPMELTFVSTGRGHLSERRPDGRMPSRGAIGATGPGSQLGGPRGSDEDSGTDGVVGARGQRGSSHEGSSRKAPAIGHRAGTPGRDHRISAPVTHARPSVKEGYAAVPANAKGRPEDNVDADQSVSRTLRSLIHASPAGGSPGAGAGGSGGGGAPATGGTSSEGSKSGPLGAGDGSVFDLYSSDPRLLPYFRQIQAKILPLLSGAFPREALLAGKQGMVILVFTISQSGAVAVAWPPTRASGIPEYDKNCADAVRRAGPFPPIPASLGRSSLTIRAPFITKNPVIQ